MVISGERNLFGIADLSDNMDRLRRLFDLFERKTGLLQLLDASSHAQGVQIFIGGESELVPMDEVSVVMAPYEVDGKIVGTARRHRPHPDGLRPRDPHRRHHREAGLHRAEPRRLSRVRDRPGLPSADPARPVVPGRGRR